MRTRRGRVRRLAHGRDRDERARRPRTSSSALLSNDVTKIAERGAQYSVLCREDGGVLDDLFTYRLGDGPLPDRHERVEPRARTSPGSASTPATSTSRSRTRTTDWAMLAVQGPRGARRASSAIASGGELPARMRTAELEVAGVDCLVCGTGYTGEDGVELLIPPDGAGAVWDALMEQGVTPAGLGARDTLRLEVCFHLYGNDLSEDRNPIEAGLALVLQARHGLHRRRRARAASSPSRRSCRSPSPARAFRARATRCARAARRRGRDERLALALPGGRDRDGVRSRGGRGAGHGDRGRRARQAARRRGEGETALPEGDQWLRPATPRT